MATNAGRRRTLVRIAFGELTGDAIAMFGLPVLILTISIALQVIAAGVALNMIRVTGRAFGWVCFAAAVLLMAVRRAITLGRVIATDGGAAPDPAAESVALVISTLMLVGLVWIGQILRATRPRSADACSRSATERHSARRPR